MNKTVVIHKYALFFDVTLIYKSKYFITGVESYYLKLMEQSISVVYHSDQFGLTEASKDLNEMHLFNTRTFLGFRT